VSSKEDTEQIPDSVVAIDGPSGSGKSTVSRGLARALGYAYLDTGAMYRAVTWFLLGRQVVETTSDEALQAALDELDLSLDPDGKVLVDGKDVTAHLRAREVESRVSLVSARPAVRRSMRKLQRQFARSGPIVAEGRDIATVVFPNARWKFYLDAEPEERARRRREEFLARGRDVSAAEVLQEMAVRDRLDSTRKDAPLTRTTDATYVDTTGQSIEDVVARLQEIVTADD
jgi:cytidylate kinase